MAGLKYRALLLGTSGSALDVRTFDSESDASAIERARRFEPALGLELWTSDRLVAKIPRRIGTTLPKLINSRNPH